MRKCALAVHTLIAAVALTITSTSMAKPKAYVPVPDRSAEGTERFSYAAYRTTDKFGRTIRFYITKPDGTEMPAALFVEGSGCESRFRQGKNGPVPNGGHFAVAQALGKSARVIVVEKPGVPFLRTGGRCEQLPEFNRELTLDRWVEANNAALQASRKLPGVKASGTLVIGHSEGGLVAAKLAGDSPKSISHAAIVAGGGNTQLFDLITIARKGIFFNGVSSSADERVKYVTGEWAKIQAKPFSDRDFFFGFAYRRWASFLRSSPIAELQRTSARVYVAQGTADTAVDPASADALYAGLLTAGKNVTYDRVENADHSFSITDSQEDGWSGLFVRIRDWFAGK